MKTRPGTRLIILGAISVTCVAAVFVFAQSPQQSRRNTAKLKFHLKLRHAAISQQQLNNALKVGSLASNDDQYLIQYDYPTGSGQEGSYAEELEPVCDTKNNSNVTQHLAMDKMWELQQVVSALSAKDTPTPTPTP